MNALLAESGYGRRDPSSRIKGIVVVVALHVLIGYALVSGMAREGLDLVKKPLEAVVIQEVMIPPPPPPKKIEPPKDVPKVQAPSPPFVPPPDVPPPAVSTAPAVVASPAPPPAPPVITPPAPPAAPVAVMSAPLATTKQAGFCKLSCDWTPPEVPRRAYQEGFQGKVVVKAEILLKNNIIEDSKIVSGPKIFYSSVKNAISQSKCRYEDPEVRFEMEFAFNFEDEVSSVAKKTTETRSTTYKCSSP